MDSNPAHPYVKCADPALSYPGEDATDRRLLFRRQRRHSRHDALASASRPALLDHRSPPLVSPIDHLATGPKKRPVEATWMGEAPKNVAERRCGLRRGPWHLEIRIRAGAPSSVAYIEGCRDR